MEIILIPPIGFCKGVTIAVEKAEQLPHLYPNRPLYLLGEIVHNSYVNEKFKALGFHILSLDNPLEEIEQLPKDGVLVLSAHGHPESWEKKAKELGLTVIDLTCPFVNDNQTTAVTRLKDGYNVIYLGKKGHLEALSVLSISDKIHLLENDGSIPLNLGDKVSFLCQTTLSEDEINHNFLRAKEVYPHLTFDRGRCFWTKAKQDSLKNLKLSEKDVILLIGSQNSNNAKELYSLIKKNYPNNQSYMIDNEKELEELPFKTWNKVYIATSASTCKDQVDLIISFLKG